MGIIIKPLKRGFGIDFVTFDRIMQALVLAIAIAVFFMILLFIFAGNASDIWYHSQ